MNLKISSAKWQLFYIDLNMLMSWAASFFKRKHKFWDILSEKTRSGQHQSQTRHRSEITEAMINQPSRHNHWPAPELSSLYKQADLSLSPWTRSPFHKQLFIIIWIQWQIHSAFIQWLIHWSLQFFHMTWLHSCGGMRRNLGHKLNYSFS